MDTYEKFKYWGKWTIHCAAGELLGIGCAGGIAYMVNTAIGEPQTHLAKIVVLLSMMFAGFLEGTILSWFQWKVLAERFRNLPRNEWMLYTILVAVLGWFLGMLPSLYFVPAATSSNANDNGLNFSNPFIFALLSISIGLVLGTIFGLSQWFSLRKYVHKAYQWIYANAFGWGLGIGWIYLFASLPTESSSVFFNITMGIMGGVLAGLSVGAVTGFFLVKLTDQKTHS